MEVLDGNDVRKEITGVEMKPEKSKSDYGRRIEGMGAVELRRERDRLEQRTSSHTRRGVALAEGLGMPCSALGEWLGARA